ncbi:S-layer homology domain-containing protein [Tumebacillus permanentifrigoris]|uniref:S-layer family protein n=1 Tax=Tumebacillus permanentifrigoris TaxID=378543 RepID=A0A316D6S2_9BACL|nr:S-layer homology domain-containing protein [Tumebacillus permanentifrigoris]PWK07920.1 S-layer family protein [Tumebacillus permanentifrigoris]
MIKRINKWLAATLVLTTALVPSVASAATFTDLTSADLWAQAAIVEGQSAGLFAGDPSGQFRPLETISRQEMAKVFANVLSLNPLGSSPSAYSDVADADWAHGVIEALRAKGLMTGDGDGTFRPDSSITREEMAVLLVRAFGQADVTGRGTNLTVADRKQISSWAQDYVQAAIDLGLMKGDGAYFHPQQAATRQEVAVVAMNLRQALQVPITASVVTQVTSGGVTIGGMKYGVSEGLKSLFSPANAAALRGAKVDVEVKNGVVTRLKHLELTAAGLAPADSAAEYSGNVVFNGHGQTVDGDVRVLGDYVTLQDVVVAGDMEVASTVQNDFAANGVSVQGTLRINGGSADTVTLTDAHLNVVEVNKPSVHVVAAGLTTLRDLTVKSDAYLSAESRVLIPSLTIGSGVTHVDLNGKYAKVKVIDKQTRIKLVGTVKLAQVTIPADAQVWTVFQDYGTVQSMIDLVNGEPVDHTKIPDVVTGTVTVAQLTISAINKAADASVMQSLLEHNANTLGIVVSAGSEYAMLTDKSVVATAVLNGKGTGYLTTAQIKVAFETAVQAEKALEAQVPLP